MSLHHSFILSCLSIHNNLYICQMSSKILPSYSVFQSNSFRNSIKFSAYLVTNSFQIRITRFCRYIFALWISWNLFNHCLCIFSAKFIVFSNPIVSGTSSNFQLIWSQIHFKFESSDFAVTSLSSKSVEIRLIIARAYLQSKL